MKPVRYSIILCTYNPEPSILHRSVSSCCALVNKHADAEFILVDNNSEKPAEASVKALLADCMRQKVITETKQGLVFARIAGFKASYGSILVFADDDNILQPDYLDQLDFLLTRYPYVGAWGPGQIDLDYVSAPPVWIKQDFEHLFQRKSFQEIQTGNEEGWPQYYPAGSGLILRRDVMERYHELHTAGMLTAGGRTGKALTSGEDSQMVWTALRMGLQAGTAPSLRLTHIIPSSRLSMDYLLNLQKNLGYSYSKAFREAFPEKRSSVSPLTAVGYVRHFLTVISQAGFAPLRFSRMWKLEMAWFRGIREAWRS